MLYNFGSLETATIQNHCGLEANHLPTPLWRCKWILMQKPVYSYIFTEIRGEKDELSGASNRAFLKTALIG